MSSYTNIFSGNLVNPAQLFYAAYTLSSNITLAWSTDFGANPLVLATYMDINPTNAGYSVALSNAQNVSNGLQFSINNKTSHSFILYAFDGATIINTIKGPSFNTYVLADNTSANGTWDLVPYGTGGGTVTSIGISTSGTNGNITESGSPITLNGTISIGLGADLAGLTSLGADVGLAVRDNSAGSWSTVTLTGTANQIGITSPQGIGGSPTFSLAPDISGINSIALSSGNLSIGVTPNTIAANNANGSIFITPLGVGSVSINSGLNVAGSVSLGAASSLLFTPLTAPALRVGIFGPSSPPSAYNITLPANIGSINQVLEISNVQISGSTTNLFTQWASVGSGTVTSITAGTNLTGGTITGSGTIALNSTLTGLNTITIDGTPQGSGIVTSPPVSSAVNITLSTAYQNSTGYDALFTVFLNITAGVPGNLQIGVGNTNPPNLVTVDVTSADAGLISIPLYVPANYYLYIGYSGITVGFVNAIVTYI